MAARVRARVFPRVPARMSARFCTLLHDDDVRKVAEEDAATNIYSPIIYDPAYVIR